MQRRRVAVFAAGEWPRGTPPARGERTGQACSNFSLALCVSSMSGPSKRWHTSTLPSVQLRDKETDVCECALVISVISSLPKEHSCTRSTDLSPLHSRPSLQDFHSSRRQRGLRVWTLWSLGISSKLGPLHKLAISRLERPHCTCDTCQPGIYLTYIIQEINRILLFPCNKFSTKPFCFL